MVKLEAVGSVICAKDRERMQDWEYIMKNALDKRAKDYDKKYVFLQRKVMFGCYVMLFARSDVYTPENFKYFQSVKVKVGAKGMAANKGAVALRFNFYDSSFLFISCHLSSGQGKADQRFKDANQCYNQVVSHFEQNELSTNEVYGLSTPESRKQHDYQFLFGDLNFRCNFNYYEGVALAEEKQDVI